MADLKNKTIEELQATEEVLTERLTYERGKSVAGYEMKKLADQLVDKSEREQNEICEELREIRAVLNYCRGVSV